MHTRRQFTTLLVSESPSHIAHKFEQIRATCTDHIYSSEPDWTSTNAELHPSKNRYTNVHPWDRNRVRLPTSDPSQNYINASHVYLQAPGGEMHCYTAAQGPTTHTTADFWLMIASDVGAVSVIVMLTQTYEGHVEKCAQYWPTNDRPSATYRAIDNSYKCVLTLTEVDIDRTANCTISTMTLDLYRPALSLQPTSSKTVRHIHFKHWSDHSAPGAAGSEDSVLALARLANRLNTAIPPPPITVHCSAGIGRTGTFIAIDFLQSCYLNPAPSPSLTISPSASSASKYIVNSSALLFPNSTISDAELDSDPIYDTVSALRHQRMLMVHNIAQYNFIYKSIARLLCTAP
ncbi:protein-tyrosine phosphatase-like protein [Lipomyces oligophaga]|uniref:protein-tyrosine phosphatase-like protein n=1 Tax=Lipomyces oligophaga TaxID=45792 RepID=UPI0034CEA407